ncbi:hypothetical protein AAG589_16905 [Isoptericola sp. F-RaC21]|uniref:hypothetical protein n=1 Tax=Isoptericola sp. F-RaC21 TaxID=3141452 RepID=UPI00315C351B
MTARGWFALLGAVVLLGVAVALQATGNPWAAVPVWAFWGAVVVALVVRVVRARSLRRGLRPAGQGIDEVQDLYLGRIRPPVDYGDPARPVAELVEPVPDDPLAGGRVTLEPAPDDRPPDAAR